jgi:hypothetical protein
MVYLLKIVMFYSYVKNYQRVNIDLPDEIDEID